MEHKDDKVFKPRLIHSSRKAL